MEKFYCISCGEDVEYKVSHEKHEYDYKDIKVEVYEIIKNCACCGEELYDEKETERVLNEVYSKYLETYGISFDKLKDIRNQFGLSQDLFAKVMNWSKKTIIRYENMYSVPQGEFITRYVELKKDPSKILNYIQMNRRYVNDKEYNRVMKELERKKIYCPKKEKLKNLILYFLNKKNLYTTQLMKFLFAADFYHYKGHGVSITGSSYARLPFGPVLDNYKEIINDLMRSGVIEISDIDVIDEVGGITETYMFKAIADYDISMFTYDEIKTIDIINNKFKNLSSKKLSDWSHDFIGWKATATSKIISYDYAKDLKI